MFCQNGFELGDDFWPFRGHVFLLDQDSIPAPDCVARLCEAETELRDEGVAVAALGPRIVDRRTGRAYSFKQFSRFGMKRRLCTAQSQLIDADFVIASGTLSSIESMRAVGPMDDGLFIDRIDIDWCLRARAMGRRISGVCGAKLLHEPGQQIKRVWIGRWREIALHSPERTYYMVRNSILLYGRAHSPLRWIVADILWLCGVVLASCLFAPSRFRRVKLAVRAISHGLRKATGPLVETSHPGAGRDARS